MSLNSHEIGINTASTGLFTTVTTTESIIGSVALGDVCNIYTTDATTVSMTEKLRLTATGVVALTSTSMLAIGATTAGSSFGGEVQPAALDAELSGSDGCPGKSDSLCLEVDVGKQVYKNRSSFTKVPAACLLVPESVSLPIPPSCAPLRASLRGSGSRDPYLNPHPLPCREWWTQTLSASSSRRGCLTRPWFSTL